MKKTKYLVAALLLMGATTTFTSCIDNDEPAGIEELRGAKAELIKAKAAVELANEAFVRAKVAEQELVNKGKEIANQQAQLNLEIAKYNHELQKEQDELKRIELQRDIENVKHEIAINAERYKKEMLAAKLATAQAEKSYDDAMKALELSKLTMSDDVKAIVAKLEQNVKDAWGQYVAARGYFDTAASDLNAAIANLNPVFGLKDLELKLEKLELAVEQSKLNVAAAEEALAKNITSYIGWENESKELAGKIAVLDTLINETNIEIVRKQQSEEGRTLNSAVEKAEAAFAKASENLTDALDGKKVGNVNYTFGMPSFKIDLSSNKPLAELVTKTNNNLPAKEHIAFDGTKLAFDGKGITYNQKEFFANKGQIAVVVAMNGVKNLVAKVAGPHAEDLEWHQRDLAAKEADLKKAQEGYTAVYKKWEEAVENFKNGKTFDQVAYDKAVGSLQNIYDGVKAGSYASDELKAAAFAEFTALTTQLIDNGQDLDAELIKTIADYKALDAQIKKADTKGLLPTGFKPAADKMVTLEKASKAVFGEKMYLYLDKNPRLTAPTAEELAAGRAELAKDPKADFGQLGNVWKAEDAVKEVKQRIALNDAIAQLNKDVAAAEKAINDAIAENTAKVNVLITAKAEALAARKAAKEAYAALTEAEYKVIAKAEAEKKAHETVKAKIDSVLAAVKGDPSQDIVIALKNAVVSEKEGLAYNESQVERQKVLIEQFKAGEYTKQVELDNCKEDLEYTKSQLEQAQKHYNEAVAELNKVLAELAK